MKSNTQYLHLYLNSVDVIIDTVSDAFKAHFGHAPGHKTQLGPMLFVTVLEGHVTIKPLLRKLSSMTEEEDETFRKVNRGNWIDEHWYAEGFAWLLKQGFDIFNLIDDKLAIDLNLESKEN